MAEDLAAAILAPLGLDAADAERPFSQANHVWLVGDMALRIASDPRHTELRTEAALWPLLPAEVGLPALLDAGWIDGHAFTLAERLPGTSLAVAWPSLTEAERVRALRETWARLVALHETPLAALASWEPDPSPFYALDRRVSGNLVERLRNSGAIPESLARDCDRALDRFDGALADAPASTVVHSDIHPGNVQWHGEVIALLDFEFATIAPPDLDLDSLVGIPARLTVGELPVDAAAIAPELWALPGAPTRAKGYAVLRELWALETWCKTRDWRPEDVVGWRPRVDLEAVVAG